MMVARPLLTAILIADAASAYIGPVQQPHRLHRHAGPRCNAAAATAESKALATIAAAPPATTAAFDLAEQLSTQTLPHGPWRHAFRGLLTDDSFLKHGWAKMPFKLDEEWQFAVGSYTMHDVERDITLLPPQFVAHGVTVDGGIFNKPFPDGFTFADVDAAMEGATVVMLNAGFLVPKLARVSLAMLEASQLPIWLNVYLSKPGLTRSTQLHTDKQDVLLVQSTGRKRWRVYRPPPPSDTPQHDPFARGKGKDLMQPRPEDLLIDTVMGPGQVLYIPAGFPHETDTIGEVQEESSRTAANEHSVHLTVGIDTHLWGLSYAKMREVALTRSRQAVGLPPHGLPLTNLPTDAWSRLHEPLPVGFLVAPALASLCEGGARAAAGVGLSDARSVLCDTMAAEVAARMLESEPDRWPECATDASALSERCGLAEAAERMLEHHRDVLSVQSAMYIRASGLRTGGGEASSGSPQRSDAQTLAALFADMDALDAHMARLDGWGRGMDVPRPAPAAPVQAAAAPTAKAGFGGGKAKPKAKGGGKKRK
jgi:hypothetical protein